MKKHIVDFGILGILLAFVFSFTGCISDGDETISLEFANVKKMIVGEWVLESANGTPRVLTFTDDGYYTDSSDGGTKKHTWRLASDYSDGSPYYGGIYLDGVYYEIVSLGDGHWRLKDKNGKILDFGRDSGTNNGEEDPVVSSGDYVNLGLPSGTLWASCNVGASKPEEYGDCFAWGETKGYKGGKTNFSSSSYKWCSSNTTVTKYCTVSSSGKVDNKTELDLADDAAYVNCGSQWRMPSLDQIKELIDNCNWEWTTLNGVYGCKVTSKKNGKSIFLPAAGYRYNTSIGGSGTGNYWSRSLRSDNPLGAYDLVFGSDYVNKASDYRWDGQSIRPVRR